MDKQSVRSTIDTLSKEIQALTVEINQLANLRLVVALGASIMLVIALWYANLIFYIITAALIALFIFLIRRFSQRRDRRDYKTALRQVHQDRIARYDGDWKQFSDTGADLLGALKRAGEDSTSSPEQQSSLHRYHLAHDLDVLGSKSLFQRINLAFSPKGRQYLSDWLLSNDLDVQTIHNRQEAVRELLADDCFSSHYAALLEMCRTRESKKRRAQAKQFIKLVQSDADSKRAGADLAKPRGKATSLLIYILPALTCLSVLLMIIAPQIPYITGVASVLITAQLLIAFIRFYKINGILQTVEGFNAYISIYKDMITSIETKEFTSPYLQELQSKLRDKKGQMASASLKELERLGIRTASRQNTIAWLLLNGLLLWDEHCLKRFRIWREEAGQEIEAWLLRCSEMEALLSLASVGHCYDEICWPEVETGDGGPCASIEKLAHPLIDNSEAVANDARLENTTYIITGSNMSGKTTYLRSIGLAVLMAEAGAAIPAKRAKLSALTVHSSIRVDDNVSARISSFYAEILRIRAMAEASQAGVPMLILIDEIFSGTNSADRIMGAEAAVTRLSQDHTIVMVSTHDMELCRLETNEKVQATNLHFQEYYENNEIFFDYQLRPGQSQTTNARFLLRMAGIMDESALADADDVLIE